MRELGRTGIEVSAYCLGTMMFGPLGNPDHDDCVRMTHRALDAGINFVDTADVYGYSETEVIVGKVRAIGSSNLPPSEIVEAQWVSERRALHRLRTEQPTYSILNRGIEREVLPVCRRYGLGVLVWGPLSSGLLSGRYRKGAPREDNARMHWVPKHLTDERKLDAVEQLIAVAQDAGMPLAHMAMAFATTHPGISAAIIGPRTMEQLEDLLAGAAITLGDDILDKIDEIVPPGTDVGPLDISYDPPAVTHPALRRRPADDRAVA
ncbi:aldo/keto reductase [Microbispora rosea]|nr:aldo/keto reductase [Microbispora rosea]GIH51075.1 hypothetical protein Mro03_62540 [Microbispora rosea subsp. rosea]